MSAAAVVVYLPRQSIRLADNRSYTNRFKIRSETSDAVYIIAQSKSGRWWSCSCFGWIRHKHCKHLRTIGLPGHHRPHEVQIQGER